MKNFGCIAVLLLIISFSSCRTEFDFEPNTGNLSFSRDTVYLDTVFTNIGSSTYTLKVYNNSNKNIAIPSIKLGEGENSKYRLMVDGMPGKTFENVELLADDSLFVFIETTIDYADYANNTTEFLYTDYIEFGTSIENQKVELVTLVQDAVFLYPQKFTDGTTETLTIGEDEVYGFFLDENDAINGNELQWTNEKPYVIYGFTAVPSNKTLEIEAGTKVHFHKNSGIIVANNASLHINGLPSLTDDLENEVVFQGDRLEPLYEDNPGQWFGVWFTQGSTNNVINNLTLKNARIGIYATGNTDNSTTDIQIRNSQIYNCSNYGIYGITAHIDAFNTVINNCGDTSLACVLGGKYNFTHCTIANYFNSTQQSVLVLTDFLETSEAILTSPLEQANFNNCILYGSNNISVKLSKQLQAFNYQFNNSLFKFYDLNNQLSLNDLYNFNSSSYNNCVIVLNSNNTQPNFLDVQNNSFVIDENSAAKGIGNFTYSQNTQDLNNLNRTNPSDAGAYNFGIFD